MLDQLMTVAIPKLTGPTSDKGLQVSSMSNWPGLELTLYAEMGIWLTARLSPAILPIASLLLTIN